VSVSYPLPGTKFFERVREGLGEKTNWSDSEDLSMMFTGPYSSEFYRAIHQALHEEVKSWCPPENWRFSLGVRSGAATGRKPIPLAELWERVEQLERISGNSDPTQLPAMACSST